MPHRKSDRAWHKILPMGTEKYPPSKFFAKLFIAGAEDRATLESDLSAAVSGYTAGQGETLSALSSCPAGSPKSDKLIRHGAIFHSWATFPSMRRRSSTGLR